MRISKKGLTGLLVAAAIAIPVWSNLSGEPTEASAGAEVTGHLTSIFTFPADQFDSYKKRLMETQDKMNQEMGLDAAKQKETKGKLEQSLHLKGDRAEYETNLPGATVTIGDQSVVVGPDGIFSMNGLVPGEYEAKITLFGKVVYSSIVKIVAGSNQLEFTVENAMEGAGENMSAGAKP